MKKNVSGQKIGAQLVSATDGSAFTSAVTVYVTGDAGTQAVGSVGSGACTHEGNGYHTYAPAQAETNYDLIAFTFTGTGAIPATVQAFTTFPQTGDNFARLGAPAGASVSADIAAVKAQTAAIETDTAEIGIAGAGLTNINLPNQTMDITGNITGNLSGSVGSVTGLTAADVGAIKAKTDNLPSDPADASVIAGRFDTLDTSVGDLPTNAELTAALASSDDAVLAQVALVKAKTDSLTFTSAGKVDSNITAVNGYAVTGDGETGTEWGPA